MSRHVIFYAQSGDIAYAPLHESEPTEVVDDADDLTLDALAEEHMWESVRPDFWWEEVDDQLDDPA